MQMLWSAKNNAFVPVGMLEQYNQSGWDLADGVVVNEAVSMEFMGDPPQNKIRVVGDDGMPAWEEIPPLTHDELLAANEMQRQELIDRANDYMNERQWPGKAAIGRLKDGDLTQYNIWLDYLDALEALDISNAPEISWPNLPIE